MTLGTARNLPQVPGGSAVMRRGGVPFPVLAYIVAVCLPMSFAVGPIIMTPVRLVAIIAIIPAMIGLFSGRFGRVLAIDILFILHIFWATAALAVNNPQQVISNSGSTGIEFLGGYLLARAYVRSVDAFLAMVRMLGIVVLCLLPFVLYETLTGTPLIIQMIDKLPGVSAIADALTDMRLGLHRVQAVFAHPIHFGLFGSLIFSLVLVGLRTVRPGGGRVLVAFIAAGSGFLSLSSGAFLAILMQFFLVFWGWALRTVRRKWLILFGLIALAYVAIDLMSNRSPIRVFMTYATFSATTAYWRGLIFEYGMQNVWANPMFGIGLNDWVRPDWMHTQSVDNFWLLTAMRYGIPGFLFLAAGYAIAFYRIGRRDLAGDMVLSDVRRAWMYCMVGMTFTLCTVHVWHTMYSFVFFVFGAGMWLITARPASATPVAAAAPRPSQPVYSRPPPQPRTAAAPAERSPAAPLQRDRAAAPSARPTAGQQEKLPPVYSRFPTTKGRKSD